MVRVFGGLGNQLVQVCAGLELASRKRWPLALRATPAPDPHLADLLDISGSVFHMDEGARSGRGPRNARSVRRAVQRMSILHKTLVLRMPTERAFDAPDAAYEALRRATGPVVMRGYFQHEGYLGGFPKLVADRLARRAIHAPFAPVRLHLRRGDYVRLGWQLPATYYTDSLTALDVGSATSVEVVSDDVLAARGLVSHLRDAGWDARVIGGDSPIDDLFALANAEKLVMANSTFSWWPALIGDEAYGGHRVAWPDPWLSTGGPSSLMKPTWTSVQV